MEAFSAIWKKMEGGDILFGAEENGWRSYNGKETEISNS